MGKYPVLKPREVAAILRFKNAKKVFCNIINIEAHGIGKRKMKIKRYLD